ncbi:MAG: hypothetical protein ABI658_30330 [Acidimicrobiales bacterium]
MLSAVSRARRTSSSDVFWSVERADRVRLVAELVSVASPTVVFTRSSADATRIAGELSRHGVPAAAVEQRDFNADRVRARVVTDDSGFTCPANSAQLLVHFDPATNARRYRRRFEQVANPSAIVVTLVVPERIDETTQLLTRLDGGGAITSPDVSVIRTRRRNAVDGDSPVERARTFIQQRGASTKHRTSRFGRFVIARVRDVTTWLQSRRRSQ